MFLYKDTVHPQRDPLFIHERQYLNERPLLAWLAGSLTVSLDLVPSLFVVMMVLPVGYQPENMILY